MAKFTSFDAPQGVAGAMRVRSATASDFGGDGTALKEAGRGIAAFSDMLKAHQDKRDNAMINQTDLDNQGFWDTRFREAQTQTDANATDFTGNILKEYDANMAAHLDAAPNDQVKTALKLDFTRTRNKLVSQAIAFEAVTKGKNQRNIFTNNGDTARNLVRNNPTEAQLQQSREGRAREIANMAGSAGDKAEMLAKEDKDLRYSQVSGELDAATTAAAVDAILKARPVGELTAAAFVRLEKEGDAKKSAFKTEARALVVAQNKAISDANTEISTLTSRLSNAEIPIAADLANAQRLVSAANDPNTDERMYNVMTVGNLLHGWVKLPETELAAVVGELEADVEMDGATVLESLKLSAARKALSHVSAEGRADQAEVDATVREAFNNIDKRLSTEADLSKDPDMILLAANLPGASPDLQGRVNEALAVNQAAQDFAAMQPGELMKAIDEAEAHKIESDPALLRLKVAKDVQAKMASVVSKNYADWQQHVEGDGYPPLDQTSREAMERRAMSMENGARIFGKARRFHTTSEVAALGDKIAGMSSTDRLGLIRGYTENLQMDQAALALNELAEVSPNLAFVGVGMAVNPAYVNVGNIILRGEQLMAADKNALFAATGEDTPTVSKAVSLILRDVMNNPTLPAGVKHAVEQAALAYMATGAALDYPTAVNKVLGGDEDGNGGIQYFNGSPFVAPVGVHVDDIEDALDRGTDSLKALSVGGALPVNKSGDPVDANTILDAGVLENVGPNLYYVRMKSDNLLLQGAPGRVFTLHITPERLSALGGP